jgi:hypothetical protein
MGYELLRLAHVLGAVLIGSGLNGVWISDLRSRQLTELKTFAVAGVKMLVLAHPR